MEQEDNKKRRVLFPIDRSDHCHEAWDYYVKYLLWPHDQVIFIHVVEPEYDGGTLSMTNAPFVLNESLDESVRRHVKQGKELCEFYTRQAKDRKISHQAYIKVACKIGESLLISCEEMQIDFIVISSRGLGAIRRTFLGSVSDYLLHHAHLPMTIIPTKAKAEASDSGVVKEESQ